MEKLADLIIEELDQDSMMETLHALLVKDLQSLTEEELIDYLDDYGLSL